MERADSLSPAPVKKRRWYQFSLRTLMIFMLLIAAFCGWFGVKYQQAKRQSEAIAWLNAHGGDVYYYPEEELPDPNSYTVEMKDDRGLRGLLGKDFFDDVSGVRWQLLADPECGRLEAFPRLKWVDVSELQPDTLNDQFVKQLTLSVPQLEKLTLSGFGPAMGDGLAHLRNLPRLKELRIEVDRAPLTALQPLLRADQIQILRIDPNRLDDELFALLEKLPALYELSFSGSADFADKHLPKLLKLQQLQVLKLYYPELTPAGLARLKELPKLHELLIHTSKSATPESLQALQNLKQLRVLIVTGSSGLPGLAELEAALPQCAIRLTPIPAPSPAPAMAPPPSK